MRGAHVDMCCNFFQLRLTEPVFLNEINGFRDAFVRVILTCCHGTKLVKSLKGCNPDLAIFWMEAFLNFGGLQSANRLPGYMVGGLQSAYE